MGVRGSRQKQGCKAPSYLCRPTQLRFVAAREDLFVTKKGWDAKHPFHCAASAVAEAMAGQAASQARLPHGGIYLPYGSDNPDRKTLPSLPGLLIINQPFGLFAERGGFVLPEGGCLFFGSFVFCSLILSGSVIYYCL